MTRRTHPRVLLVEGKDELRLLPEILEQAGVPWPAGQVPVFIKEYGGIDDMLAEGVLGAELQAGGLLALGVLVDADANAAGRWRRIRDLLAQKIPDLPTVLPPDGLVHAAVDVPRVGVWIMPDNQSMGMLETLMVQVRGGATEVADHAVCVTRRAAELGAPFTAAHHAKAVLATWLAWQEPPGLRFHDAARKRLFRADVEALAPFVMWFRRLFGV
jgi:hypothetical protein